jgi:hypothetical protein
VSTRWGKVQSYREAFNGTTVFVEEVRTGEKELAFNTMYKQKTGSGSLQKPSAFTSETTPQKTKVQQIIDSYKDVSVVRDKETGEPLTVWHGSIEYGFDVFKTDASHNNNSVRDTPGAWFTDRKTSAVLFVEWDENNIYEVF